jgi:hypothetical protein
MTRKLVVLALAAAVLPVTSCESTPPEGLANRQCFHARNVQNFRPQGDRIVNVRVAVNQVFQFELMGSCPNLNFSQRLGLRTRGSQWICSGLDADLIVPSTIGPSRCPVNNIRRLTPEEVAALPRGARP